MATTHLGWENRLAFFWERPLGSISSTGPLWLSTEADSMSLGAEATRRTVYGNRYMLNAHLQVLKSSPGGSPGSTPMWFAENGTNTFLNRILNSHFQNTYEVCPIDDPCFVAHFPISDQPGTLGGFSIARDIGLGFNHSYLWTSCVANELAIEWKVGNPITIKPTFVSLDGQANGSAPGLVATSQTYQDYLFQAPNIACTWNGTAINTAGFKITSTNNIMVKHDPSSISPVGMTYGRLSAKLEFKTWVDDDFYTKFVPDYLGSGASITDSLGTFKAVVKGPAYGTEGQDCYGTIFFYGKIVDIPNCPPAKDGIQTINVEMTTPDTGTAYTDAGYYVKIDGVSVSWQNLD